MGKLVDGQWTTEWYKPDAKGRFVRQETTFRKGFTPDGEHPAQADRYRLYVAYACPWAHRTLIVRALKGLEAAIPVSFVHWFMGDDGWTFDAGEWGSDDIVKDDVVTEDPIHHAKFLREIYVHADPKFTGRVTVPIVWDTEKATIVNNESREIIRAFDHDWNTIGDASVDLCPADLRDTVESTIDAIYQPINNGVYRCGFATSQEAYDEAVTELFDALDHRENVLSKQRYLCGDRLTEADVCLFTTLLRFDIVYHTHFKCNVKRIADYPNLWGYTREIYQMNGVAETCNFDHTRKHYYASHETVNPKRIVARGPEIEKLLAEPHRRG